MRRFIQCIVVVTSLFFVQTCFGQSNSDTLKPHLLTADSLASGNYKDVLTSFFQLALNDLSGPQKNVEFSTNPFAIMAKGNPKLLVDTSYLRYKHLRNLNLSAGVYLDSAYHLTGFNFGIKYALINARDVSISHEFVKQDLIQTHSFAVFNRLVGVWVAENLKTDRPFALKFNDEFNNWTKYDTLAFNKLSPDVQKTILSIIDNNDSLAAFSKLIKGDPNFKFKKEADAVYKGLVAEWQNKPLWTVAGYSSFTSAGNSGNLKGLRPDNITLNTEFLAGLNSPHRRVKWDLDILAIDKFMSDTTNPLQNINVNTFEFQPGFNFVLKSHDANGGPGKPFLEFKISGSYYHTFSTLLPGQKADSNTINGELRLRLYQDFWVPVTIKYDPATGNVLGFLSIKANFTALAGALKKLEGV